MAYQSRFTGQQIDDVIDICRKIDSQGNSTLKYLDMLSQEINKIQFHEERLSALNDGSYIPNKINSALNGKLSLSGGTMQGQIKASTNCDVVDGPKKALLKIQSYSNYNPIFTSAINDNSYISAGANQDAFYWYYHEPNGNNELAKITTKGQVFGAVWNDYAEFRISDENEAGRIVCENGDGTLSRSYKRLQPGACAVSDTYGFSIGETEVAKCPIAVSGRVLVYPYEDWWTFEPGEPVCAGPNGTVSKMTRREVKKYPERIIGTVSELPTYEIWGQNNTKVNGRIWIRVK